MRRMRHAVTGVVVGTLVLSMTAGAQAARGPRAEAGVSMMLSPSSGSRIPEVMMGPMLNVTVAEVAGGVLGVEGAMRFRTDGNQMRICPAPPGTICDARNVNTLGTAGLVFRRGFGAMPMQQGATLRAGVGAAFTSLKGAATIFPFPDGTLPTPTSVQKNAAMLDLGLGWVQRYGRVPLRVEGRVNGFAPELANTRYTYGVQFGIGY
jgi:hypothetical protein